jgi:hypothetical protein
MAIAWLVRHSDRPKMSRCEHVPPLVGYSGHPESSKCVDSKSNQIEVN